MQNALNLVDQIHEKAVDVSARYKSAEAELIEVLQQVEQHKVFLKKGHASMFLYVIKELRLSESVAYNLITVSRKAREVLELKTEIQNGKITLSNARKIIPILNKKNKSEWLTKASKLSHRQLEKEVAKVRPQLATPERATYVTGTRVRLELGLSEKDMLSLRRVQDLLCQSRQQSVTLEEVLVSLTHDFLKRHDPVEKAKRQQVRTGLRKIELKIGVDALGAKTEVSHDMRRKEQDAQNAHEAKAPVALQVKHAPRGANDRSLETYERRPIPAEILHRINLRDQKRCQFINSRGERCNQVRWTEIHHKIPVSQGGINTLENLTTLCSAHHGWVHSREEH